MGIQGGVENLQWVFTGTFLVMLLIVPVFGWAVARFPRHRLVPLVYYFFIANLLVFFLLFKSGFAEAWIARAFFIWVSVFNLFVVSVFWSFMADIFTNAQARRLFAVIAVGGSAGAVVGPALTAGLAPLLGADHLLPLSMAFLFLAVVCVHALVRWRNGEAARSLGHESPDASSDDAAIRGGMLSGATRVMRSPYLLGICLFMVLYTTLSTFLYFQQAHIVEDKLSDSGTRTAFFATIDLATNVLTVLAQLFVTARVVERFGLSVTLMLVPALLVVGFVALGLYPALAVILVVQVVRRAGNYAVARPAREVLYTVVSREDKYKSKNFIDTVVYRGGDAASGWAFAGLVGLGFGLSSIAFIAVPVAAIWVVTGLVLGRQQEALRRQSEKPRGQGREAVASAAPRH